jgi:glycine amidinotransferase/scyllo-inosamine-4-phosphate amidinotransferase 1
LKIHSYNEWDPLKSIIVGSARHANWPTQDPVFAQESEKTLWKETPVPAGPVPNWIIDEAEAELDDLANKLTDLGVEVHRPTTMDFVALNGMYNYCPRDRLLVAGTTIVDPAMMYPCRDMELAAYYDVVDAAERYLHMPRNEGMTLDAANVCRLNDTWLYLESASGNRAAYDWLCKQFPEITIELCNFYAGVHIDSTIVPLREGLVIVNAARVTPDTLPRAFEGWEVLYVDYVIEQDFYQYPYASKWIALNMLVVDPHTVVVDQDQKLLIRELEKNHGFTVIPHKLSHSRTLGGGFHCVTLDLWREHA